MRTHTLLLLLGLSLAAESQAVLLVNNGSPDLNQGVTSDVGANLGLTDNTQAADDFTWSGGGMLLTSIEWWGFYADAGSPPGSDTFMLRIFGDAGGAPASMPTWSWTGSVARTSTADQIVGFDVYRYVFTLPTATSLGGGQYWLSILNDTSSDSDDDWLWATAGNPGNGRARSVDGDSWGNGVGRELAFRLYGGRPLAGAPVSSVPEPGVLFLLGIGALALHRCFWR